MRRREFITLLGSATAWPLTARAQQPERLRRIGVLIDLSPSSAQAKERFAEILEALKRLGWIDGNNVHIAVRWAANQWESSKYAAELIALSPDAILAVGHFSLAGFRKSTTIPIVFTLVPGPIGAGYPFVPSEFGANVTGCIMYDMTWPLKWLELLKKVAPSVTRAGVLLDYYDVIIPEGDFDFLLMQFISQLIGGEVIPIRLGSVSEIEMSIRDFARSPHGGLIVNSGPKSLDARDVIIALAARNRLPTVYVERSFAEADGLLSYGPSFVDELRRGAVYIDRILRGEKLANLPVLAPKKYELVINLKTARTLGLNVPRSVLSRADEVIE